ncbi:MAG: phosphotransferase [Chloroflexi bacterium]|nr:phosphotransferase [Chloroflexota bacterium]
MSEAWLTAALQEAGVLPPSGRVASFEWERVGEGAGFMGIIARVRLTYDGDSGDAPATVIAKFPTPEPGARAIGEAYGLYEREARFYRDLAPSLDCAIARAYYVAMDEDRRQFAILLEDLATFGTIGDQLAGCTPEAARTALLELARLHVAMWDHPRLAELDWLQRGVDIVRAPLSTMYGPAVQPFIDQFGHVMPEEVRSELPGLAARVMALIDVIADEGPMTVIHGDFRLDNIFFSGDGPDCRVALVDWQTPNRGWGAYEVAYFLSGCLTPEDRRASELDILRAYHAAIAARAGDSYAMEDLLHDYKVSLLTVLALFVINGTMIEMTNDRAVALFEAWMDRLMQAIHDHDALAVLPPRDAVV